MECFIDYWCWKDISWAATAAKPLPLIHVASVSPSAVATPVQIDARYSRKQGLPLHGVTVLAASMAPLRLPEPLPFGHEALADDVDHAVVAPVSAESQRSRNRSMPAQGLFARHCQNRGRIAVYGNDPRIRLLPSVNAGSLVDVKSASTFI
jgi:hypothetical protein